MARKKSIAKRIVNFAGAAPLTDYAGAKLAKAMVPKNQRKYIEDKTTRSQAMMSGAQTAGTIATIAGGGAALSALSKGGRMLKFIGKGAPKVAAKKITKKKAKTTAKRTAAKKNVLSAKELKKVSNPKDRTQGLQTFRNDIDGTVNKRIRRRKK